MRPKIRATAVAALLLAAFGAGRADPVPPVVDVYEYRPDAVYPVRTALGITTRIELDPADEVLDYSTGFSSGWDLTRRGSVFYLRPRAADVDTNLQVRTQAHSYIFELKVVASDWRTLEQARRSGVQYKIAFRHPPPVDGGATEPSGGQPDPVEVDIGQSVALVKGRRYHFGYAAAARRAPAWLVPVGVHDDGRFTYVRMGTRPGLPTGMFPAVFGRRHRDGEEYMVNTSVEEGVLVVHGIHPYLVLRHGRDVVGIRRDAP